MISIRFLGAARHVTGSKYLLTVGEHRVLLECGLVQGPRKIAHAANRNLGVDPASLDAVVLSHAHVDHSGALPRLVKLGYDGLIHCTEATRDLAAILLADSAHIQAADARHLRKRGEEFEPYYDADDVDRTVARMRGASYHEPREVCPGVTVEFYDAGHILGSAMVVIDADDGKHRTRIAFTGDHGRAVLPILRAPERLPDCDWLITESTYGDREHESTEALRGILADGVLDEMRDGGRILIPAFSVGRTQNLVLYLGELIAAGKIPAQPIFVDSPLARKATVVMAHHAELFDKATRDMLRRGEHPFFFDGVRYVADVEESKSLNGLRSGIVIAASGMCEAGRILHHLAQSVGRRQDCVLLVGFQAQGTLGRRLQDGHESVRIFGERYPVRCKIRTMRGLSAHADWRELLDNTRHLAACTKGTFVVHGEEDAAQRYAERLRDANFRNVEVPVRKQEFALSPGG